VAIRYPVEAEVSYRLLDQGSLAELRRGTAVNLSRCGVRFKADCALPLGAGIEVMLAWPNRLNVTTVVELKLKGRTVRTDGNHVAVQFEHCAFVTRPDN